MGRSKALLPHLDANTSFLGHLVAAARSAGAAPVLVVGRRGDRSIESASAAAGAVFVPNDHAEHGQLSSVIAGIDAADGYPLVAAVLVTPVDVPLVSSAVIRRLLECAEGSPAVIVRATHDGRHGHPVIFKRDVFEELRAADSSIGAKAVVRRDPRRVLDVPMDEPGVIADVDTPDDYERLLGRPLPS
jgi:molybdenum cofactor cytidylyltransferase